MNAILLLSIILLSNFQAGKGPQFSSEFSSVSEKSCAWFDPPEGGDSYGVCEGVTGYEILVNYDLYGNPMMWVTGKENDFQISLNLLECGITRRYGATIDWRLAAGRPFACIIRYTCLEEESESSKAIGEYLLVRGLVGFEQIEEAINVATTENANVRAHELADQAYLKLYNHQ